MPTERRSKHRAPDPPSEWKTVVFRCEHPASGLVHLKSWRIKASEFAATAVDSTILDHMHHVTELMEQELRRDFVNVELLTVCDGVQNLGRWDVKVHAA